jgi:hypothetical protein
MYCSKCGAAMASGSAFCTACGQAFSVGSVPPPVSLMSTTVADQVAGGGMVYSAYAAVPRVEYAGFWERVLAFIIDNVLIGVGIALILIPLLFLTGLGAVLTRIAQDEDLGDAGFFLIIAMFLVAATASIVVTWLYQSIGAHRHGHGGPARQLWPFHRQALRQDHHQSGSRFPRIHHGRVYREEAGAPRHDGGLPGPASKHIRRALGSGRLTRWNTFPNHSHPDRSLNKGIH